jgi:hypothetical protein
MRPTIPYRFAPAVTAFMTAAHPAVLEFPHTAPPAPGATIEVVPGLHWLRMPLPFALDHINLWLLDEGEGWTLIDTGYGDAATRALKAPPESTRYTHGSAFSAAISCARRCFFTVSG